MRPTYFPGVLTISTGLYTDESPGLKVDPVVVMTLSVVFIISVVMLHGEHPFSHGAWKYAVQRLTISDSHCKDHQEVLRIGSLLTFLGWTTSTVSLQIIACRRGGKPMAALAFLKVACTFNMLLQGVQAYSLSKVTRKGRAILQLYYYLIIIGARIICFEFKSNTSDANQRTGCVTFPPYAAPAAIGAGYKDPIMRVPGHGVLQNLTEPLVTIIDNWQFLMS